MLKRRTYLISLKESDRMNPRTTGSRKTESTYLYFALKTAALAAASSSDSASSIQLLLSLAADPIGPGGACLLLPSADGSFIGETAVGELSPNPAAFKVEGGHAADALANLRRFIVRQSPRPPASGVLGVPEEAFLAVLPAAFRGELQAAMLLWAYSVNALSDQVIEHAEVLATQAAALLATDRLSRISRTDELTGVHNYRALAEILGAKIRKTELFSIILLEIDDFRQINNVHGHQAGNRVLQQVSEILRANARTGDYVTRLGGDEFVILLNGQDKMTAKQVAERLRIAVSSAQIEMGKTQPFGRLTASIGVASFPQDGDSPEQVLERADEAAYRSKIDGKDRVTLFRPGMPKAGGEYQGRKILGTIDPVSGLYDRAYMLEQLAFQVRVARHFKQNVCLALMDIDHLREVNEGYGPSTGDSVIREIALEVIKAAGESSYVCRYQGDEIAIIMPGISMQQAIDNAYEIKARIKSQRFYPAKNDGRTPAEEAIRVTVSIGLAEYPADAMSAQDLLMKAGLALLQAKEKGRDSVCSYSQDVPCSG